MTKFEIQLGGEVQIGLDGEELRFDDEHKAREAARELEQVWARELRGDRLEVVEVEAG